MLDETKHLSVVDGIQKTLDVIGKHPVHVAASQCKCCFSHRLLPVEYWAHPNEATMAKWQQMLESRRIEFQSALIRGESQGGALRGV